MRASAVNGDGEVSAVGRDKIHWCNGELGLEVCREKELEWVRVVCGHSA